MEYRLFWGVRRRIRGSGVTANGPGRGGECGEGGGRGGRTVKADAEAGL